MVVVVGIVVVVVVEVLVVVVDGVASGSLLQAAMSMESTMRKEMGRRVMCEEGVGYLGRFGDTISATSRSRQRYERNRSNGSNSMPAVSSASSTWVTTAPKS